MYNLKVENVNTVTLCIRKINLNPWFRSSKKYLNWNLHCLHIRSMPQSIRWIERETIREQDWAMESKRVDNFHQENKVQPIIIGGKLCKKSAANPELTTTSVDRPLVYSDYHFGSHFQFVEHKATSEEWLPVNNGHKFWVPRVVTVPRFD